MRSESNRLRNDIETIWNQYKTIDEKTASIILSADKWSLKEIIVHLVDSAGSFRYSLFIYVK